MGADLKTRAVLTHENRNPIEVTSGQKKLGFERVSFEVAATEIKEMRFTDDDWNYFNETYQEYANVPYKTWSELPADLQMTILRICERKRLFYGCGAGVNEITVDPKGKTYDCHCVYRGPRSMISDDLGPAESPGSLQTMVDDRLICQDCWARYLCGGGCMHQTHLGHGKDEPIPQYCVMKRNMVEASIVKVDEIRTLSRV